MPEPAAVHIETEVTFEDGRKGSDSSADLSIRDARRTMRVLLTRRPEGAAARPERRTCCSRVDSISLRFGGVRALTNVSFDIRKGEIRAIIGPNGAGKSSMLNVINGFYRPQEGEIRWKGVAARRMTPYLAAPPASPAHSRTSRCSRA